MPRFPTTNPTATQTNELNSPETCPPPVTASAVPTSFADWLAQPTCDIAADSAPVQGTFAGLMNQCAAQNMFARPFRR